MGRENTRFCPLEDKGNCPLIEKEPRNLEFTRKIGSFFMLVVLKRYYFNFWSFSATSSRLWGNRCE